MCWSPKAFCAQGCVTKWHKSGSMRWRSVLHLCVYSHIIIFNQYEMYLIVSAFPVHQNPMSTLHSRDLLPLSSHWEVFLWPQSPPSFLWDQVLPHVRSERSVGCPFDSTRRFGRLWKAEGGQIAWGCSPQTISWKFVWGKLGMCWDL